MKGGSALVVPNPTRAVTQEADANRGVSRLRSLFECIRTEMAKGSPEGYNAETGLQEPAQKPKPGEPNERQPLYRIRCTQEKYQLLRKVSRRKDCRGRQTASHPQIGR